MCQCESGVTFVTAQGPIYCDLCEEGRRLAGAATAEEQSENEGGILGADDNFGTITVGNGFDPGSIQVSGVISVYSGGGFSFGTTR